MNLHSTSNLRRFTADPIRQYAREAVAATKLDRLEGVVAWRIADYLCSQMRDRSLDTLPMTEQENFVERAVYLMGLMHDYEPTAHELLRYEQRKTLRLAEAKVRHEATRLRHQLEAFRVTEPGRELAFCLRCHAGVTIYLDTAGISRSPLLESLCEAAR